MSSHPEKDSTVSGTLAVACSTAGCSTVSQGSMPSRWDKEKRKSAKAHYVCTECLTRTNDTRLDNYTKSGSEVTFRNDGFRARFLDMKDIGRRQGDEESSMLDALKTAQLNNRASADPGLYAWMKEEGAITAPASNEGTPIPTKGTMILPLRQQRRSRYSIAAGAVSAAFPTKVEKKPRRRVGDFLQGKDDGSGSRNGTLRSEVELSPMPTQESQTMTINWKDPYKFLYED